jgi:ATP-dependent helicase/nuclease subunit A
LLLPDDDLALATALKSPLFGFDDDQLYKLAHARKSSLRAALNTRSAEDPMFGAAAAALDQMAKEASELTPFAFYAHVLGARKGRRRFLARLGIEASDPLDEFLNLALDYERRETPSLQGFLNWIRAAQSEVKRDMEMARDEVRVMTVHGAKGLEAKNVILADSTTIRPEGAYPPRLLSIPLTNARPDSKALVWAVGKDKDAVPMGDARTRALEAARDEYRRLLYVGLTRAAERLVVCGAKGVNKIPEGCWYNLVLGALKPLSSEETDSEGNIVWRFRKDEFHTPSQEKSESRGGTVPPDWLARNAPAERTAFKRIRPSAGDDDDTRRFAGRGDRDKALRRGTLVHRLMQSLPDIPQEQRAEAARRYLARSADDFSEAERDTMSKQVLDVLTDSRFAPLFAAGSRAEVSIAGNVKVGEKTIPVPGQVDRLAITQGEVLIADFKTNRPAPKRIGEVPPHYVRQLALYRAVLQKLYPDRAVRAALIWTEVPDLMEVSAGDLDAALTRVTSV